MEENESNQNELNVNDATYKVKPLKALIDLVVFFSVMICVRTFYIELLGFWGNVLFKSISTVGVASLLLLYRKQSWKSLGLRKPKNYLRMLGIVAIILAGSLISLMLFEIFIRDLFPTDTATASVSNFEQLKGNIPYFFSIIFLAWIESSLEELQDRGFSLNRFESLFSKIPFTTALAVLAQAAIFGFRHSYDFSPRSITTGLIGLVFGIVYVVTGRNLWPLIIAHIMLNTISLIGEI